MAIAYNIPVDIPQVSGAPEINLVEFKRRVQEYVNSLYVHVTVPSDEYTSNGEKYSKRLQHLREISKKVTLTPDDIQSDERLAYLLSK